MKGRDFTIVNIFARFERVFYLRRVALTAFIALFMAPIISKRIGKKRGAILIGILAFSIAPAPVVLRSDAVRYLDAHDCESQALPN